MNIELGSRVMKNLNLFCMYLNRALLSLRDDKRFLKRYLKLLRRIWRKKIFWLESLKNLKKNPPNESESM